MSINKSTERNSIALDLSSHNLNNSSSKQKFSFPKASRFESSKFLYVSTNADVIRFTKYPVRDQAGLLHSGTAIKIWGFEKIDSRLSPPLIRYRANLINVKRAFHSESVDKSIYFYSGNGNRRTIGLINFPQVHSRPWQL